VLHAGAVRAWEGTIEIPTYLPGAPDPSPPFPLVNRHNIYPYPMLDDLSDHREMKSYRALFLENEHLRATILPELGGRLYSLYDKSANREVFYRNHVVKYGLVALRGAWISGGIEFNFPNGHTTLTVSPVEAQTRENDDGSATVIVGAMDWVTGMHWEVALTLRPGEARLEQRVALFNSTPLENLYWYWANAAVPATNDMQFDYPMREANPHVAGEAWTYPVWNGVDYSWYKNVRQPTSLFGRQVHRNFFGAYYHDSDFGVVHVADFRQVPGKKIWSWGIAGDGLIWTDLLTDHDGAYNEIQSGRYETQLTQEFMPPRRIESWTEYWYPAQGLGSPFVEATDSLALAVGSPSSGAVNHAREIALLATVDIAKARVVVKSGEKVAQEFAPVDLQAGIAKKLALPAGLENETLAVDVEDHNGRSILHWSAADPVDGNPDFVSVAGAHEAAPSSETQGALEAAFLNGVDQEKRGDPEGAVQTYRQVLERDPAYIPALLKLAWRSYRAADFSAAEDLIKRGLARSGSDPQLQYAAGVIYRAEGRWGLAEDAFWTSIHFGGPIAPALAQLGEISIYQKRYEEAASLLHEALSHEPEDTLTRDDLAVALRLGGHSTEARRAVVAALKATSLFPLTLAEDWRLGRASEAPLGSKGVKSGAWDKPFPQDVQYYLELAAWYLRLGDFDSANETLGSAHNLPSAEQSPLVDYYLGYIARQRGHNDQADGLIEQGSRGADNGVFPNRLEDDSVLADAASHCPKDGHVASLLGTFLFAHGRYDEAAALWRGAVENGYNNAVLERNLGVYAWRVKGDLQGAAAAYDRAIRLAPDQYRFYPELDEIYSELGETDRRTQLFRSAPAAVLDQDVVRVRRALLMIERRKFDEALNALSQHRFKPWEGGQIVREMYVLANLQKGRSALEHGSPAEAEKDFRRALEYPINLGVGKPDRPADAEPLYWLGVALDAQGKTDAARAAWRRAADESAGDRMITQVYRAAALLRLGQTVEGRRLMDQAIAGGGTHEAGAMELYAAGLAQDLSGNEAEARRSFQHALDMNRSYWQARVELERIPAR